MNKKKKKKSWIIQTADSITSDGQVQLHGGFVRRDSAC